MDSKGTIGQLLEYKHAVIYGRGGRSKGQLLVTTGADAGRPMGRFAVGLKKDLVAVRAGLTATWPNGPVEGFVHKLKLLKRQGYGRAGFDLDGKGAAEATREEVFGPYAANTGPSSNWYTWLARAWCLVH